MSATVQKVKTIAVYYGADAKRFEFHKEMLVSELLAKAIVAFSIVTNAHMMSLYDEGRELVDTATLGDEHVTARTKLVLRQSAVKGG